MNKQPINLGTIQETLLITLWARATETTKKDPILKDIKSAEIIQQIDYDFSKLGTAKGTQVGVCLRGQIFDEWVKTFLQKHPNSTVVEIGAGLNTRYERINNNTVRWFDLDLPDAMEIRQKFFQPTESRSFISASVLDSSWIEIIKNQGNNPIMFIAEGVFMYFSEEQVKQLFATLIEHFPGCYLVFDSMSSFMVKNQNKNDVIKHYQAKFIWGLNNIKDIEKWDSRYQVLESKILTDLPPKSYWRMGFFNALIFYIPPFKNMYRLNLVQLG